MFLMVGEMSSPLGYRWLTSTVSGNLEHFDSDLNFEFLDTDMPE